MRVIHKQTVRPNSIEGKPYPIVLPMRPGSTILSVANQEGQGVCVWYETDTVITGKLVDVTIYCVGTGFGSVPPDCEFFGTVIDGTYVWHFYKPIQTMRTE